MKNIKKNEYLKNLTVAFLILLIIAFIIIITLDIYYRNTEPSKQTVINAIGTIKEVFNILFFIIVGGIGILSYLQARKTLFTPIKTETFKMQLKSFEEVLLYFQNLTEIDFNNNFDLDKIVYLNASQMFDNYAKAFFKNEIEFKENYHKEKYKELIGAIIHKDIIDEYIKPIEYESKPENSKETTEITNPAVILAQWNKYKFGPIGYTKKYIVQTERLRNIMVSPLLPSKLKVLLNDFLNICRDNLSKVGEVLVEISKEMPEKYPNVTKLKESKLDWIWNRYNKKKIYFEKKANEILEYINEYLQVENITK